MKHSHVSEGLIRILSVLALGSFLAAACLAPEPPREPFLEPTPEKECAAGGGVQVVPAGDLGAVAAAHPAGTTFCLIEGTFTLTDTVVPEPGDAFIGAGQDTTFIRPAGVGSPSDGFVPLGPGDAGETPITYQALDIGGFSSVTTSTDCNNACGTAIWNKGDPLTGGVTLRDVRCHDNGTSCVGHGFGSVFAENIECDANGFHPDSIRGDFRSSACIKLSEGSLTLRDSYVHDNAFDGIWCDFCGNTVFLVEDNVIVRNGRSGVHWEVSGHFEPGDNAIVRNNLIQDNGNNCSPDEGLPLRPLDGSQLAAGVIVEDGQNILIEGNTFGGNSACEEEGFRAVNMWDSPDREPANANIEVRHNTLNGDRIQT